MKNNKRLKVLYSPKSRKQISAAICKVDNKYETGGILVGFLLPFAYLVTEITLPEEKPVGSQVSFVINGEHHTICVRNIIENSVFKKKVLGIWHSHICCADEFSQQDKVANNQIETALGYSILSAIAIAYSHYIVVTTYKIGDGKITNIKKTKIRR